PGGGGRLRDAQAKVTIVVISHPHDAQQSAGVSGETSIVGASCLACGWGGKATTTHSAVSQAVVDDGFHHVGGHEGYSGIENLTCVRLEIHDHIAVIVANRVHHGRSDAGAAVGKNRVSASHVQGSGVVSAQSHGRCCLD